MLCEGLTIEPAARAALMTEGIDILKMSGFIFTMTVLLSLLFLILLIPLSLSGCAGQTGGGGATLPPGGGDADGGGGGGTAGIGPENTPSGTPDLPPFLVTTPTPVPDGGNSEEGLFTVGNFEAVKSELRAMYVTRSADYMWVEQDIDGPAAQNDDSMSAVTINIDPGMWYQPIDGFGASFTDSAAYLINSVLPEPERDALMVRLFDPDEGIGLSFLRNPMGSSDFARFIYSYNDIPEGETDFGLEHFSIDHDRADILPLTLLAQKLNPDLKLVVSPWSPPGWMKTTGSMIGGALRRDCYDVYGDYFVRVLDAYRDEGVDIYAVTPQNEPLYVPGHYPGCSMPAAAQISFINQSLGPKLREHFPDVKLLCYDHNWDNTDYAAGVLSGAGEYVDGVAWHVYGGTPDAQTEVLRQFPDSEVHFTEASGGEWVPPFNQAFFGAVRTGIEVLNNYSRSMVLWNMALDENNGPVVPGFGRSTCRGVVKVNQQTGELTYNLDYYVLAHFSKFIRPGAVRVFAEKNDFVYTLACLNSDNTLVIVAMNDTNGGRLIRFNIGSTLPVYYRAGSRSAVTLVVDLSDSF